MSERYINPESKEPFWLDENRRIELAAQDDDLQEAFHQLKQELAISVGLGNLEAIRHARAMIELALEAALLHYRLPKECRDEVEVAAGLYYLHNRR